MSIAVFIFSAVGLILIFNMPIPRFGIKNRVMGAANKLGKLLPQKPEKARGYVARVNGTSKQNFFKQSRTEAKSVFKKTGQAKGYRKTVYMSVAASACGILVGLLFNNVFLSFILAIGLYFIPMWMTRFALYPVRRRRKNQAFPNQSTISKTHQKMLNFLTANNIMDMAGLDEHFGGMIDKQMDIRNKLKPIERRLPVLKNHLEQADIYCKLKGKKPLTDSEQTLYAAAYSYLKDVMNGHTSMPIKAWKTEYTKLNAEQKTLNQRYLPSKTR